MAETAETRGGRTSKPSLSFYMYRYVSSVHTEFPFVNYISPLDFHLYIYFFLIPESSSVRDTRQCRLVAPRPDRPNPSQERQRASHTRRLAERGEAISVDGIKLISVFESRCESTKAPSGRSGLLDRGSSHSSPRSTVAAPRRCAAARGRASASKHLSRVRETPRAGVQV